MGRSIWIPTFTSFSTRCQVLQPTIATWPLVVKLLFGTDRQSAWLPSAAACINKTFALPSAFFHLCAHCGTMKRGFHLAGTTTVSIA